MHLGLIGGIGPAATGVYYQKLVAAMRSRGLPLELTIANADVTTLVGNALADRREDQAQVYAKHLTQLRDAGAEIATITSLGGHFCFENTKAISPLPLLSGVAPLDDYFARNGIKSIGILGTEVVMRTQLYGQLEKTRAVVPADDLDVLGQHYLDVGTSGVCTQAQREVFFDAGRRMITDQGADAVLLGGTDLFLAFDGFDTGYPVIDALDVHVDVLAQLAANEISLSDVGLS